MTRPTPCQLCTSTVGYEFQPVYGTIIDSTIKRLIGTQGCLGFEVNCIFTCSRCGHEYHTGFARFTPALWPVLLPEGWHQLPDGILCPSHTLRYEVDGVLPVVV